MSGYKIETWLKKGYTEEEARYQIAIRRPSNPAYHANKFGLSEEDAVLACIEYQKAAAKKRAEKSIQWQREHSHRCKEFWIAKGYTEEEAIQKVCDIQSTFSLDICIEKNGKKEGTKIWKARQEAWQKTLNNKSEEERDTFNKKKDSWKIKQFIEKYGEDEGRKRFEERIISGKGIVVRNLEELKTYLLNETTPFDMYLPIKKYKKKYIAPYIWDLIKKPKNIDKWLCGFLEFKNLRGNIIYKNIKRGWYNLHVDNSLLRSSNEILFYQILIEHGLENKKDFVIEKYYQDSKLRCDFYLTEGNYWVELAGSIDDEYLQRMKFKETTFGSRVLYKQKDYRKFIESYLEKYHNEDNNRTGS